MADHSIGARDEYESEASEASVFCFDNREFTKPRRQRQWERHQTKGLMS